MFFKPEVNNSGNLVNKLNLECNFEKLRLFLVHFAGNTIIKILDDNCEDDVYYDGSVSYYLENVNSVNNYYVMNCSINDNIAIIRVLNN